MLFVKQRVEEDDVRGRILSAAVEATLEGGLADLSMRDVARRAKVSHQLPYHYFTDREGILAAIAEDGFSRLAARLRSALDRAKSASAPERFAIAGRTYVMFAVENPAHFRVMFRTDFVDVERFESAKTCADGAFSLLPMLVQELILEGLPPEPNPLVHVVLGWSVAHGLACLLLDGPIRRKLPEAASARDAVVKDVMEVMRTLIEARITTAAKKKPKK